MSSIPFHYLDLRTFCYETEAESRVDAALRTLVPEAAEVERVETEGHHGDRIVILSTRLERSSEVRHVLDRIQSADDFETVSREVADRVDADGAFFVRLDKQRAFRGEIGLGDGIQLRGKVESYPASREGAIANLEAYFEAIQ